MDIVPIEGNAYRYRKLPTRRTGTRVNEECVVTTSEGTVIAKPGDLIATSDHLIDGAPEQYVIRAERLHKLYRETDDGAWESYPITVLAFPCRDEMQIHYGNGTSQKASKGHYLVFNGEGFYPIDKHVFEQTYEALP